MKRFMRFIFGGVYLTAEQNDMSLILSILISNAVPFGRTRKKDGTYDIFLTKNGYRLFCENAPPELDFTAKEVGALYILSRYRLRAGLIVGALIFAFCVSFSSLFIWDINVTGNSRITEEEILEALSAYGVRLGAFIPNLDKNDAARRIALERGDISFIAINLKGTVASISVHERDMDETKISSGEPSNLVAKYDAQIERGEVTGGVLAVGSGTIVKKGALLVSGIIDSSALGYRLVRSRGKVYGRTTLTFTSVIPLETTEKSATGEEKSEKNIKIFSKNVTLFKNNNIKYEKYDIIEDKERLYLFGAVKLPITIVTRTYRAYEETPRTLTRDEAYTLALADIHAQSDAVLSEAQIIARDMAFSQDEENAYLTLTVDCIIDIAEEIKIDIS